MNTYSAAPDVDTCIGKMRAQYHDDLTGVTVAALFIFNSEATEAVLKHQGYPAAAVCRITPIRERALGMADASIVVDRSSWLALSQRQRDALIDHELTHLMRSLNDDTGAFEFDSLDRPKLNMRRHDRQFGWFDQIAQRHGQASYEVKQARMLMEQSGQLYFDFAAEQEAA